MVEVEHELSLAQQAVKQEVSLRNDARTALQTSVEANVQTRERLAETRTKLDERDAQLKVATEQINNLQQEKTVSQLPLEYSQTRRPLTLSTLLSHSSSSDPRRRKPTSCDWCESA